MPRRLLLFLVLASTGCATTQRIEDARMLAAAGNYTGAVDVVRGDIHGQSDPVLVADAMEWALWAQEYQLALDWAALHLEQEPGSLRGERVRGLAHFGLHQDDTALSILEYLLERGSSDPEVQRAVGLILESQGRDLPRARSLLVLSKFNDELVVEAIRRIDGPPAPPPVVPPIWVGEPKLKRGDLCRILEKELGLGQFLTQLLVDPSRTNDPWADPLRVKGR
ncbi:MAG: hypothetical protein L0170_06860, partial [Acidobacteria bacterium]|nr:hypothetical protein [Acidobacteriota bacterium]